MVQWDGMDRWDGYPSHGTVVQSHGIPLSHGTVGWDGQVGWLSQPWDGGTIPWDPTSPTWYSGMGWTGGKAVPSMIYLGHRISKEGIQQTDDKVRAITATPQPTNVSELRAFLGLVNFYAKFMSNLATVLTPLYKLFRKGVAWRWKLAQDKAFEKAKELLKSLQLLVHYDANKELIFTCDASPYGLGAVLAHRMEDESERPIEYASRTLAPAEKNCVQFDKEALAIVFRVKRFHRFLFGRNFTICSDHKPLMYIFGENRGISQTATARVQRWALTLMRYQYAIVHRPGEQMQMALVDYQYRRL